MSRTEKSFVQKVHLTPPNLADNTGDADRLVRALRKQTKASIIEIDLELLKDLPQLLRKYDYHVKCLMFSGYGSSFLTGVCGIKTDKTLAGIAVDLGTTKVVLRLINLETKRILAESLFVNPQIKIGADILSRIHYADTDSGLEKINKLIIDSLNYNIKALCSLGAIETSDVYCLTIAGNTAMTHLFLGLNPKWIIREPLYTSSKQSTGF
mmetsp:Transcript_460/g.278  ORF Transcript_460/g.278 Transcript_460/m.278 type:complete len:210 (+) Transcript_460:630-1259(+)